MQRGHCRHTRGAGHAAHRKRHWPGAGHTWFLRLGLFGAVSSSTKRSAPNGLILFFFFFFLQLSTLQCRKMLLLLFSCLWLFCRSDGEQEQTHTYAFLTGLLCLGLKFVHVFGHHAHGTCSAAAQKSSVPLGGLRSHPCWARCCQSRTCSSSQSRAAALFAACSLHLFLLYNTMLSLLYPSYVFYPLFCGLGRLSSVLFDEKSLVITDNTRKSFLCFRRLE